MELAPWPIVSRSKLVQAFKPGEPEREGPFRTLRRRHFATDGVKVVPREGNRVSGALRLFSILNLEAARAAREGRKETAKAYAEAAEEVEQGEGFRALKAALTGRSKDQVEAAIAGDVSKIGMPDFETLVRAIAFDTRESLVAHHAPVEKPDLVVGTIRDSRPAYLVIEARSGEQTTLPKWVGESVSRIKIGEHLAVLSDRVSDQQVLLSAIPAISLGDALAAPPFSPFGRDAPVRVISAADAEKLKRPAAPLKVLVPVTVEP